MTNTPAATRPRILVIDDNSINLRLLEAAFRKLGHLCDVAESAEVAIEMFVRGGYELVLTDITMPGIDGFETARRLRDLEQASHHRVRIYAITASSFESMGVRCSESGIDGFFQKPVGSEALQTVLQLAQLRRDLP